MDALNAWDASTNAKSILMKLGIEDIRKKDRSFLADKKNG